MSEEQVCKEIIEQVGYQEFYRYFQEKTTLIEQQRKEIEKLNNFIKEVRKHIEKEYVQVKNKEYNLSWIIEQQRKEIKKLNNIIKEVREYIQDRYDGEVLTHTFDKDNVGELLNILKGVDKE